MSHASGTSSAASSKTASNGIDHRSADFLSVRGDRLMTTPTASEHGVRASVSVASVDEGLHVSGRSTNSTSNSHLEIDCKYLLWSEAIASR